MKKNSKKVSTLNKKTIEQMKYEIANDFGVNLGADTTAKANGLVGGEITKRLVKMGRSQLGGAHNNSSNKH